MNIEYLEEARQFLKGIDPVASKSLLKKIELVLNQVKDPKIFKKLNKDIWEFRCKSNGNQYRLFAFFDKRKDTLIVSTHGIKKKSQKTPKKELKKAEAIRQNYLKLDVK